MEDQKNLEGHRLANYFPAIQKEEFDLLVEDIKKNGQLNPIVLFEGKILDGKNRYRACQKLKIAPKTIEYKGHDPLSFVISTNIMRRHLTESQRAMLATKMLPEFEKKHENIKSESARTRPRDKNGRLLASSEKDVKKKIIHASDEAGEMFGVSGSTVQRAKRINRAVDNGELEKDTIEDIVQGKKTISSVNMELIHKNAEKKRKENQKKLPAKYPKAVKEYLDNLKEMKDSIKSATILAQEGMFSPEALQFVKRNHDQIRELMSKMEEIK
jgi:ParB-like chromosome segregation protein Spo0J